MRSLEDGLSHYAGYHRDPRNIATHFIGIPLIVVSLAALLGRPAFEAGGLSVSPALVVAAAMAAYYLRLDLVLGAIMSVLLVLAVAFGAWAAARSTADWLLIGGGCFLAGWLIQFVGHVWEGRKPAFFDDLAGLVIGPLFVLCEGLFLLGLRPDLRRAIEARVGPVRRTASANHA